MSRLLFERILSDFDPYEVACGVEKYVRAMDSTSAARVLTAASRDLPPYYRSAIASELLPQNAHLPARLNSPAFERIVADAGESEDIREPLIAYLKSNLRAIPLLGDEFSENVLHVVRGEEVRPPRSSRFGFSPLLAATLAAASFILATAGIRLIEFAHTQTGHVVAVPSPAHVAASESRTLTIHSQRTHPVVRPHHTPRIAIHAPPPKRIVATPKHVVAARPVHASIVVQAPPPSHPHHIAQSQPAHKQPKVSRLALAPQPKRERPHAIVTTNPVEYYAEATPKPKRKHGIGPYFSRLFGYIFGHPKQD